MRKSLPIAFALALGALPAAGLAQSTSSGNPSTNQIINSLRPTGPMTGGTRGIRPAAPAASEAPAVASPSTSRATPAAATGHAAAASPAPRAWSRRAS